MSHLLSWKGYKLLCREEKAYVELDVKALGFLLRWGDKVAATAFLISSSGLQRSIISTASLMEGLFMGRVLVHSRATLNISIISPLCESVMRESRTLLMSMLI